MINYNSLFIDLYQPVVNLGPHLIFEFLFFSVFCLQLNILSKARQQNLAVFHSQKRDYLRVHMSFVYQSLLSLVDNLLSP